MNEAAKLSGFRDFRIEYLLNNRKEAGQCAGGIGKGGWRGNFPHAPDFFSKKKGVNKIDTARTMKQKLCAQVTSQEFAAGGSA